MNQRMALAANSRPGIRRWFERLLGIRRGAPRFRVSFDLDDTLTSHSELLLREREWFPRLIHHWFGEPLRQGCWRLIRELRARDCSIWIYTSSSRSPFYIRRWLMLHGVFVDGVVNSELHFQAARRHSIRFPSKYPPAFGIDLHVDDSDGVGMEGASFGFRVLVLDPHDPDWVERVLERVDSLRHP